MRRHENAREFDGRTLLALRALRDRTILSPFVERAQQARELARALGAGLVLLAALAGATLVVYGVGWK